MQEKIVYAPFHSLAEQQKTEQALEGEVNTDYSAANIAADEGQDGSADYLFKN